MAEVKVLLKSDEYLAGARESEARIDLGSDHPDTSRSVAAEQVGAHPSILLEMRKCVSTTVELSCSMTNRSTTTRHWRSTMAAAPETTRSTQGPGTPGFERRKHAARPAERKANGRDEAERHPFDHVLSMAAHELRTPLSALTAAVQLLRRRAEQATRLQPDEVIQAAAVIEYQADRLARLLDHLLDSSRVDAGGLTIEPRHVDLASLVAHVVSSTRQWHDRHSIAVMGPSSLPIVADPLRLEQVLTNLLDNAIKFSPDGASIEVWLSRGNDGTVELVVRDHGPGIASDHREQIFERFYQAPGSGNQSGLGLGLYISRQIVELHGGDIHAECPSDGGTAIVVRLPSAQPTLPSS